MSNATVGSWQCNQCGSNQFTAAVSADDFEDDGQSCSNCGGTEFHWTGAKSMSNAHTPLKFERQDVYEEHAKLTGKALEAHEGYFRENDGSWVIADKDGNGIITVRFQGKAKRGQAWNAPDPEGQALARNIVKCVNAHDKLVEALRLAQPFVAAWASHYAIGAATTPEEKDLALGPDGWHPVQRKVYDDITDALRAAGEAV